VSPYDWRAELEADRRHFYNVVALVACMVLSAVTFSLGFVFLIITGRFVALLVALLGVAIGLVAWGLLEQERERNQ
jgi:uncharacterized membrane protein